jgi:hypothetical protein
MRLSKKERWERERRGGECGRGSYFFFFLLLFSLSFLFLHSIFLSHNNIPPFFPPFGISNLRGGEKK